MVGFLAAASAELDGGGTVLEQLAHPSWGVVTAVVLAAYGTMIPVLGGCVEEDFGPFSVKAERWNGRLAMLGFAALLALENWAPVPFF
jgi:hypothetical protein